MILSRGTMEALAPAPETPLGFCAHIDDPRLRQLFIPFVMSDTFAVFRGMQELSEGGGGSLSRDQMVWVDRMLDVLGSPTTRPFSGTCEEGSDASNSMPPTYPWYSLRWGTVAQVEHALAVILRAVSERKASSVKSLVAACNLAERVAAWGARARVDWTGVGDLRERVDNVQCSRPTLD